jgi:tetratricopeptide (TPR) repeat protein
VTLGRTSRSPPWPNAWPPYRSSPTGSGWRWASPVRPIGTRAAPIGRTPTWSARWSSPQEEALAHARARGSVRDEAHALSHIGHAHLLRSDASAALGRYTEALTLFRRVGADRAAQHTHQALGVIHRAIGDVDAARGHLDAALTGPARDPMFLGHVRLALAILDKNTGDHDGARRRLDALVDESARAGNIDLEGAARTDLGVLEHDLGHGEAAFHQFHASAALARSLDDRVGLARNLLNLGNACRLMGRLEEAAGNYEASLELARELGRPSTEGLTRLAMATVHRDQGHLEAARDEAEAAVEALQRTGMRRYVGTAVNELAEIELLRGELESAAAQCAAAEEHLRSSGDPVLLGVNRCLASEIARSRGLHDEARAALEEAEALEAQLDTRSGTRLHERLHALRG